LTEDEIKAISDLDRKFRIAAGSDAKINIFA
jgi:hypothetical protein